MSHPKLKTSTAIQATVAMLNNTAAFIVQLQYVNLNIFAYTAINIKLTPITKDAFIVTKENDKIKIYNIRMIEHIRKTIAHLADSLRLSTSFII